MEDEEIIGVYHCGENKGLVLRKMNLNDGNLSREKPFKIVAGIYYDDLKKAPSALATTTYDYCFGIGACIELLAIAHVDKDARVDLAFYPPIFRIPDDAGKKYFMRLSNVILISGIGLGMVLAFFAIGWLGAAICIDQQKISDEQELCIESQSVEESESESSSEETQTTASSFAESCISEEESEEYSSSYSSSI